jgi:hypothetical protein
MHPVYLSEGKHEVIVRVVHDILDIFYHTGCALLSSDRIDVLLAFGDRGIVHAVIAAGYAGAVGIAPWVLQIHPVAALVAQCRPLKYMGDAALRVIAAYYEIFSQYAVYDITVGIGIDC